MGTYLADVAKTALNNAVTLTQGGSDTVDDILELAKRFENHLLEVEKRYPEYADRQNPSGETPLPSGPSTAVVRDLSGLEDVIREGAELVTIFCNLVDLNLDDKPFYVMVALGDASEQIMIYFDKDFAPDSPGVDLLKYNSLLMITVMVKDHDVTQLIFKSVEVAPAV